MADLERRAREWHEDRFRRRHTLTIPTSTLAEIAQHAEDDHPHECCGFILDDNSVQRMRNVQPIGYAAYLMAPLEVAAVLVLNESRGRKLKVIYHSHPNMGAFFSTIDRDAMTSTTPGQPDWPDARYIVIGTRDAGQLADARAYQWNPAIKDFSEITLKVE